MVLKVHKRIALLVATILLLNMGTSHIMAAAGTASADGVMPIASGYIPTYYQLKADSTNIYWFDEIIDTKGRTAVQYRVLDVDGEMYPSDVDGNKLSETPVDFSAEKPQPGYTRTGASSFENMVTEINHVEQSMVEYSFVGRYRFNFAATSSLTGSGVSYSRYIQDEKSGFPLKTYSTTSTDPGYQYDFRYGFGAADTGIFTTSETNGAKSNGSYAVLEQPLAEDGTLIKASNVKQAFLVMEAAADGGTHSVIREDMVNRPMTLLGPSGGSMLSNGYLPEGHTVDGSYNSDVPTIFHTALGGNNRLRSVIITDVTEFVRQEGYGTYYGYDIPSTGTGTIGDFTGHWKLIVVEEDPTMQKNRIGSILIGNINSSNRAGGATTTLDVSFGGYRTPASGEIQGQFLFSSSGSNVGQNQCSVYLYPNSVVNESVRLATTSSPIPRGAYGSGNSFGQSIIGLDGVRRTNFSSSKRTTASPNNIDGTDFELLEIAMDANGNSLQTTQHNAKLVHNAESIKLELPASTDGDNYIVAVGAFATVEMPVFESSVTHTEVETGIQGQSITAGNKVLVEMSTVNVTNSTSATVGLTATRATINVDANLVDLTGLNLVYYDYGADYSSATPGWDSTLQCVVRELSPVTSYAALEQGGLNYYYDETSGTIYANVGVPIQVTASGGTSVTKQLFNSRGDVLNVTFTATSSSVPATGITNSIRISGEDAVTSTQSIFELTPNEEYTFSLDVFDSTSYPQLSKDAYLKDGSNEFTVHANGAKDAPYQVDIGREIQYRLTLTNTDVAAYDNITVTDVLPSGLELTAEQVSAVEAGGGSVTESNGIFTVSFPLSSIASGSSETFVFTATVADNGIVLKNQAEYTMQAGTGQYKGVSNATYHIRRVQTLAIEKQIVGNMSGVDLPFPVLIKVTKGAANLVGETTAVVTSDGFLPQQFTVVFSNGELFLTIRHGQTIKLELPVGWDYEVTENLPANDAKYNVYAPELTGATGTIAETAPDGGYKTSIKNVTAPALTKNAYINGSTTASNGSTVSPVLVTSGGSVVYELVLTNDTDTSHSGIAVTDVLPAGLANPANGDLETSDGSTASYNAGTRTVTWDNVSVPANSTVTLRIKTSVTATVDSVFTNVARYTMNFNGKDIAVESNNTVHQVVSGTLGVAKIIENIGAQEDTKDFNFKITLSNLGITSLNYVVSGPYASPGVQTMTLTSGVGTFTLKHGQTLVFRNITAGVGFTVEEMDPQLEGYYAVYSGISGSDNTGTVGSVYQQLTVTNHHLPSILKNAYINGALVEHNGTSSVPATVKPGDIITYKISVYNNAPEIAHTFTVEDTLPSGLTFVEDSSDGLVQDRTITWADVTVDAGETEVFSFDARVEAANSYEAQINFQNTASYSAASGFSRNSNTTYHAIKPAVLQVEKHVARSSTAEQFEIAVALSNPQQSDFKFSGSIDTNVYSPGSSSTTLTDLPAQITFADGEASLEMRHDEGIMLYLPQGMTYQVVEQLAASQQDDWLPAYQNATGLLGGTALVSKVTNHALTSDTFSLQKDAYINNSPNAANGSSNAVGVDVGDTITYKLTLTNELETALSGVTVSDELPAGMQVEESGSGVVTENDGVYTVTWSGLTLPAAQSGTPGKVELSVKVSVLQVAAGTEEKLYNNTATAIVPGVTAEVTSETTKHKMNFYTATHEFVSSSSAWILPTALLDLLPADIPYLTKGASVSPGDLDQLSYAMPDGSGVWTFDGWNPTSDTVGTADLEFTGTWEFSADWYAADYQFEHTDGTTPLPGDLDAFLPVRETEYSSGEVVTPKRPAQEAWAGEDPTNHFGSTGTWVFLGWDKSLATITDENVTFIGKWDFVEDKYPLYYRFTTHSSLPMPDEVKELLPLPSLYDLNAPIALANLTTNEISSYQNDGTWRFESFTPSSNTMVDQGVLATGLWSFSPNTYSAAYSFLSNSQAELPDAVKALLPPVGSDYVNQDVVTPPALSATRVLVGNGEWNFYGWDEPDKTVNRSDVAFTGTWAFSSWYQARYEFRSGTDGQALPQELLRLLPQDETYYPSGTALTPAALAETTFETQNGVWLFERWEQASLSVLDEDVTFVGYWVFKSNTGSGNDAGSVPQTGDHSAVPAAIAMLLFAAFGGLWVKIKSAKASEK